MTRTEITKLAVAVVIMAAASLLWDASVNGGHPAYQEGSEPMKAKVIYKDKSMEERDMHPDKLAELSKLVDVACVVTHETSKLQTVYVDGLASQYNPVTCKFV